LGSNENRIKITPHQSIIIITLSHFNIVTRHLYSPSSSTAIIRRHHAAIVIRRHQVITHHYYSPKSSFSIINIRRHHHFTAIIRCGRHSLRSSFAVIKPPSSFAVIKPPLSFAAIKSSIIIITPSSSFHRHHHSPQSSHHSPSFTVIIISPQSFPFIIRRHHHFNAIIYSVQWTSADDITIYQLLKQRSIGHRNAIYSKKASGGDYCKQKCKIRKK
jgi:hypothetical protein